MYNTRTPNKTYLNLIKRNLALLHFTIRSDLTSRPVFEGSHQAIYKYIKRCIKNEEADGVEVAAIDKENNSSLDPMPVDKWIDWWEFLVLPTLLENNFNDDLMIAYPNAGTDLNEF